MSSGTRVSSDASSAHEAVADATTAINQWQDEPRRRPTSYKQLGLFENDETLNKDSAPRQASPREPSPISRASTRAPLTRSRANTGATVGSIKAFELRLDGIDSRHVASPDFAAPPPTSTQERPSKRKASQFSLRSLTNSLAKRPRLGLGKLATHLVQSSTRRVSAAKHKWRQQSELEKRQFEA